MNPEQLPTDGQIKFAALRDRAASRKAMTDSSRRMLRECEARSQRLSNLIRSTGDEQTVADFQHKLDAVRAEWQRLNEQMQRRDAEYRDAMRDLNRCEDWLAHLSSSVKLRAVPKRPAKFSADELAAKRAEIAEVEAELSRIESAPPDTESLKASKAEEFERVMATAYWEERAGVRELCVRVPNLRQATVIECLWWAFPDRRAELLDRIVPPQPFGMPSEAKREQKERLAARLLTLERAEEAMIEVGEVEGLFIERRPTASPLAMLGICLVSAALAQVAVA